MKNLYAATGIGAAAVICGASVYFSWVEIGGPTFSLPVGVSGFDLLPGRLCLGLGLVLAAIAGSLSGESSRTRQRTLATGAIVCGLLVMASGVFSLIAGQEAAATVVHDKFYEVVGSMLGGADAPSRDERRDVIAELSQVAAIQPAIFLPVVAGGLSIVGGIVVLASRR